MGYEAIGVLPYAYWLHLNDLLDGTQSGVGSEAFYWFSPNHRINPIKRDFSHTPAASLKIPSVWIHRAKWDWKEWAPPPLKSYYSDRKLTFEKPTVIIYNKFSGEWGGPPINFLDLPTLRTLFEMLCPKYAVVYINANGIKELEDNEPTHDLGDGPLLKKFPKVINFRDLGGDWNEMQCRVMAGCERFISLNGFGSILSSFFGGRNFIYSKRCQELMSSINSFYNYRQLGGSHVTVSTTHEQLLRRVRCAWVDERPLLNILCRTHQRPRSCWRMMDSITGYDNVRVLLSYDDDQTWMYAMKMRCERLRVTPSLPPKAPMYDDDYRKFFAPNAYLNDLAALMDDGYGLFMDDDDLYLPGALGVIAASVEPDKVLLWRVRGQVGTIPSDANFGKVIAGDISMIGFAAHHSLLKQVQWEPWRRGDYRVIKRLLELAEPKWLDEVLTAVGDRLDGGMKDRIEEGKKKMAAMVAAINSGDVEALAALRQQRLKRRR